LPTRRDIVLEYRFADARGRWRWMRDAVTFAPAADGRPGELVGSWIDITDRREAEDEVRRLANELEDRVAERTAQLASSEARYRTIFEAVPVAIGEEDWSGVQQLLHGLRARGITDGAAYFDQHPEFVRQCLDAVRIVRLNRKALALHEADEATGAPLALRAFFPSPDDLSQFVGELEAFWSGQRVYTARKSLPSLRGRPLSLMVSISLPALDDADAVALTCLVDITEVDRLNAELDRSLARLRQSNKELETFTYSVSHDLKAPLRGIDGYSRLLLSDHHDQLDDEGRRFLGHIRRATQHMGALIDDLLAYSRLERRELALTSVALDALVAGVLEPFGDDFARDGVELCVDVPHGLRAQADAQGVAIALRNLVDNALKFSRQSRPRRIEVTAREGDGQVRIAVRDNGLGFDMKFHDRIFDIFQRLHRAEDYPGTGVGLAIVRKAMERMGGRVWAESEPGRGATFFIVLPRAA
jgi:signal transduction histidine kinase